STGGLSRRELLQRAAAAGLVLLAPSVARGALGAGRAEAAIRASTINILTWETYHDDPWLKQAEQDLGLKFNAVRAGSVDEVFAKARAGTIPWDLFLVDSGSITRYKSAGLIAPVDRGKLPALKAVNARLPLNQ